jgi:hypothetical protein
LKNDTHIHTYTRTCSHTQTHIHTRVHTHTRAHTYTRIHTHVLCVAAGVTQDGGNEVSHEIGGNWSASSEDAYPLMRSAASARESAAEDMGAVAADLAMRGTYA